MPFEETEESSIEFVCRYILVRREVVDRTKNRSDRYQHLMVESPYAPDMMTRFAEVQGMSGFLLNSQNKEEVEELRDELKKEFWRLVQEALTKRQREVVTLYAQGYTQMEIAKMLGVNQSSITKALNGNCDYRNGKRVYGGALRKLSRLAEKDEKIQEILDKIAELSSE